MTGRPPLAVSIVTGGGADECGAGCGMDWSLPENRLAAANALAQRFGQRVNLEFYELRPGSTSPPPPDLAYRARASGLALPLLTIDGEPRIAGYFDVRMLSDVVEAQLEMQRDKGC